MSPSTAAASTSPPIRSRSATSSQIKESSRQLVIVLEAAALAERDVPDYIEVDHAKGTAKMTRIPGLSEVPYPTHMEPNLVIEFYSR